jgi:hypothetical protein
MKVQEWSRPEMEVRAVSAPDIPQTLDLAKRGDEVIVAHAGTGSTIILAPFRFGCPVRHRERLLKKKKWW